MFNMVVQKKSLVLLLALLLPEPGGDQITNITLPGQ